jgi:hypothetical protein
MGKLWYAALTLMTLPLIAQGGADHAPLMFYKFCKVHDYKYNTTYFSDVFLDVHDDVRCRKLFRQHVEATYYSETHPLVEGRFGMGSGSCSSSFSVPTTMAPFMEKMKREDIGIDQRVMSEDDNSAEYQMIDTGWSCPKPPE